eukprot:269376-Pleurochrysis_carterae.AAC.1
MSPSTTSSRGQEAATKFSGSSSCSPPSQSTRCLSSASIATSGLRKLLFAKGPPTCAQTRAQPLP